MASSLEKRLKQNKGVKHGTIRTGAGGRTTRRYNARTGRWNVISTKASATGAGKTNKRAQAGSMVSQAAASRRSRMAAFSGQRSGTSYAQYSGYSAPKSSSGSAWTSTGGAGSSSRRVTRRTSSVPWSLSKKPSKPRTAKNIVSRRTGR